MAVQQQTPYIEYTANGVTTSFALGFDCASKDHLIVTQDGIDSPVGEWSFIDGNVVFNDAPINGVEVIIQRNTPLERTADYQSYNNSLNPKAFNIDLDRIWLKMQELYTQLVNIVSVKRKINTSGGLTGGGDLSNDLTLALEIQTDVDPKVYGSSIKIPVITVNDKGVITKIDVVDFAGSGGEAITVDFYDLQNVPTTLLGYGITDALKDSNNLSDVSDVPTARTNLSVYSQAQVDTKLLSPPVLGCFRNLKIASIGINNYSSVITADAVTLRKSSGESYLAKNVNVSPQIISSGANGLDTGTVAANTWYYLHLISDGTLVRGLFSLSATAPILPSGYTYFTRIGAVRAGASGYLLQTLQYGSRVQYVVTTGSNTPNLPIIAQGALGVYSSTTPTYVAASVSSFVPPTANTIVVTASQYFGGGASVIGLAPNSSYGGMASNRPPLLSGDNTGALNKSTISMLLESSNIYVYSSGANGLFQSVGWEDNL